MGKQYKYAYIIPIHKKEMKLFRAIRSLIDVSDVNIIISTSKAIKTWIEKCPEMIEFVEMNIDIITNKKTSYQTLTNAGIKKAIKDKVDFISILEFDDKVTPNAHNAMELYFTENPDVDIFLPLAAMVTADVEDPEDKEIRIIAMLNEASLATGISDDYGKLDIGMMIKANFAFVNGSYFRPTAFEHFGLFKENFEILYDYEFILRLVYNGVETMIIPKICRLHFFNKTGEFERQKNLPENDRSIWLKRVRKEYMFIDDRDLTD